MSSMLYPVWFVDGLKRIWPTQIKGVSNFGVSSGSPGGRPPGQPGPFSLLVAARRDFLGRSLLRPIFYEEDRDRHYFLRNSDKIVSVHI